MYSYPKIPYRKMVSSVSNSKPTVTSILRFSPLLKVLILFTVFVLLFQLNYYSSYESHKRLFPLPAAFDILPKIFNRVDILSESPKTPYLWSKWESWTNVVKTANESNSTLDNRNTVEIANWIEKLSKNDHYIKNAPIKKILLYNGLNSIRDEPLHQVPLDDPLLCRHKCHYYIRGEIKPEEVDAVVFISQQYYLPVDIYPNDALKVILVGESPIHVVANMSYPNIALLSYYRDADIFRGYYTPWRPFKKENDSIYKNITEEDIKKLLTMNFEQNNNTIFQNITEEDIAELLDMNYELNNTIVKNYAENKTRFAAMFVSNCYAYSNRSKYVEELKTVVSVDVYGNCGNLTCPLEEGKKCYDMLKKDYKFYLSFENSQCRGYITEKFFKNALQNDIIPIVLGSPKEDYVAVGPPNSFIHIEDFKSPKELGEYLIYLDKNETAYNEYFQWKNTGDFMQMYSTACRVCAMTHYKDFVPLPTRPENSSLSSVDECLPSGKWYWNRQ